MKMNQYVAVQKMVPTHAVIAIDEEMFTLYMKINIYTLKYI